MKDMKKILEANPSLAKEIAKLMKEELESALQAPGSTPDPDSTELTTPTENTGDNANEVRPDAPSETPNSAETNGEGHSVDPEYTDEEPLSDEEVDEMVQDVPVEDLGDEADSLEATKEEDKAEIEKLDEVIEEAMQLKERFQRRIVFTESVINKVNARILNEAAKLISSKQTLNEGRK